MEPPVRPAGHRRNISLGGWSKVSIQASAQAARQAQEGPTTTTKAMLVSVVCPRKILTKKDEEPTIPTSIVADTSKSVDGELSVEGKDEEHSVESEQSEQSVDSSVSPSEAEDVVDSQHSETMDFQQMLQAASNEDSSIVMKKELPKKESTIKASANPKRERLSSADISKKGSNAELSKLAEEEIVTEEEMAAVVVHDVKEEITQINLEELLRLKFQSLLQDWHLLNLPNYTFVRDLRGGGEDWIRVDVMARPSSINVILERLDHIGIGTDIGTISFFSAELCQTASPWAHKPPEDDAKKEDFKDKEEHDEVDAEEEEMANEVVESTIGKSKEAPSEATREESREEKEQETLRSDKVIAEARKEWMNAATRLRIEQVREQIVDQASFSFDFLALVIMASILAGVGLITNNTVVIVASMLVSPIMGPVLGLTFGSRVRDWPLVARSLRNEVLALLLCVLVGALIALGASFSRLAERDWPTNEMESRGSRHGLGAGVAIAIPSGMGVCLSLLGGNTSSLVGVAISASLLPPAVNSGICLVYAIFLQMGAVENDDETIDAAMMFEIGAISFALTAINILCIWMSGIFMFEIKEVAPTEQKSAFWKRDIKLARELNKDEQPAPVNITVLREGLKSAINKNSDKKIDKIKIKSPMPKKAKFFDRMTINAALSLQARERRTNPLGGGWTSALSDEFKPDDNDAENTRFVGVEDMAHMFGFDEDDDIDHEAIVSRLGSGRYL